MNITTAEIKRQYERAKAQGWLPLFEEMAEKHGTTVAHFLGFSSRETNMKNIRGDFRGGQYHGFGPMQVDIGTDASFAKTWSPQNAEPGIKRGGEIYQEKVDQVTAGQGRRLSVKRKPFTGRQCQPDDIRRVATAAYNCGLWAYYHFSNESHVDLSTTGKDYSRDVYDRAIQFAKLREVDGEEGALAREVQLQGKYVRDDYRDTPAPASKPVAGGTNDKVDASPKPEPPKTIPAIPPLPANVPDWAKKIVGWGAGLNIGSLGVAFATLRDNPQALAAVLNIIKYGMLALLGVLVVVALGVFIKAMWNAKLANDLNMARLHNYANKDTHDVDLSGWKAAPDRMEVKL